MLIPSRQSKLGTMPAHFYPTNVTSSLCCRTIDHADVRRDRSSDRSSDARHVCATLGQTLHTYRTSKLRYHAGHRRAPPLVVARPRSRSSRAPRDKRKPSRRARTLPNEKTWKRFCGFPPLDGRSPAIRSRFFKKHAIVSLSRRVAIDQGSLDARTPARCIDRSPRPRVRCVPWKTYATKRKDTWKNCTPRGERS